jgi:hypothetical protein
VKKKYLARTGSKGQFLIIAALLVAVVLVTALMATYSLVRNSPFETSPQALDAVNEINLALKNLLDYTVGYYCSILQVSGNRTYAQGLTTNFLSGGLASIAREYPQWNPSFAFSSSNTAVNWFNPTSYSFGNLSVTYSLAGLGIYNINYSTSSELSAVFNSASAAQTRITVTEEDGQPVLALTPQDFSFYVYNTMSSAWTTIHPPSAPAFENGTYVVSIPSGVDYSDYMLQITDSRGIVVTVSRLFYYTYTLTWNSLYSSLKNDVIVAEALQNGSIRWLGQNLLTNGKPIPPIPVKAIHVNETINGVNRQVPFQVEYWGSNYRIPLGLASNASVVGNGDMVVFLINHNVQSVTFWWDGHDTATQTSYARTNRYFTDNPANNALSNGILSLTVGNFEITASIGSSNSSTQFFRINGKNPSYGSAPSYVIYDGIVRDIVQQEAEWSGGILTSTNPPATANCSNVYSQIYVTLPANATYYTYAGRLMFLNSDQSRTIKDLSVIQLSVSGGSLSQLTENGTSGGYPISSAIAGQFYNFTSLSFQTGWAHHWSEFISSSSSGAGIMFPDNSNQELYTFDSVAGHEAGALNVSSSSKTIEFDPLDPRSQYSASFTYPQDVTWSGAVVTFHDNQTNTIYPTSGNIGLWVMVENPPAFSLISTTNVSITVTSNPLGSGYVEVDGNPITTPYTFTWTIGSKHTLQALSPVVLKNGTQYVWTGWSDGGAQNHTYSVPAANSIITGNWQTQYQVTFDYQVSGGGSGYLAPSITYKSLGSQHSVAANLTGTVWVDSGSTYSYTNPLMGSSQGEGWYASSGASGTISSSTTINPTYYYSYYLTVSSYHGNPTGQGWYTPGSSASFGVTTPASGGTGIQYVFTSWNGSGSGSYNGTNSASSVTMNNPITETASWQTQYYLAVNSLYGTTGGWGWYNAGSSAPFSVSPTNVSGGTGIQSIFTSWSGSGSGSYSGTSNSSSVTMNNPITETANWQTQYEIILSYSISGGGSPSAPTFTAKQFGVSSPQTLTTTPTGYWFDIGSAWTVTNPLTGSNSSERWQTSQTVSGTISASTTITFTYYNQYLMTLSYGVSGGGSPTAPTFAANAFGASAPKTLTTSATGYWFDIGSAWTVTNPLTGSNSSERWQTSQTVSGTVSASTTIKFTYYNQYFITFGYGDQDSSVITSGSKIGSYYQFGSSTAGTINSGSSYGVTSPVSDWVDAGSGKVSYQTFTAGSGTERWALSSSPVTFTVSSSTTISESAYYHQYKMTLSYSVTGGSGYSAPSFSATAFGASAPQTLTKTATNYWFDAGSAWTVTNPLNGGSGTYRWYTTQSTSGTVSAQTIAFVYNYQVFGIDTNCEGFGSVADSRTIPTSSMTAQANELIVIVITGNSSSSTVSGITDSFGTPLTYYQQVAYTSASVGQCLYVYYASTGTNTGSFTITVTMSSSQRYCVQAFGITGANTNTPFDSSPSSSTSLASGTSSKPTVSGISTSNAYDMILGFEGQMSSTAQTAGSSFTAVSLHNANSLGNNVEYEIVTSTQSGISVSFGTSVSSWIMAVQAVQRAW